MVFLVIIKDFKQLNEYQEVSRSFMEFQGVSRCFNEFQGVSRSFKKC